MSDHNIWCDRPQGFHFSNSVPQAIMGVPAAVFVPKFNTQNIKN
jgi:hypothetical protein